MLTRTGKTLRNGGAAFIGGGMLFGNWPIFGAGALLLLLVASSSLSKRPHAKRRVDNTVIERGGAFRFEVDVHLPRGLGVVEVHQALPDEFELVEGNNFHVFTLGMKARVETFRFQARAPKRGEFTIPPMGLKVLHPAGLAETEPIEADEPVTLQVVPRPIPARLPRDLRARAKRPFPDGDVARLGVATNDFRELREYVPGDPPRRINWKATARRMGTGASEVPLVNETEWEGKKCVWIVVDGDLKLSAGTNLEDAREHAADAALSLMEAYLRRGYQVGLALARSGEVDPLMIGTGEAQVRRAREALSRLAEGDSPTLLETLERDKAILHRYRPLVVLVTRLAGQDDDLAAAIRRLAAFGRINGRNLVPGLIVDVEPFAPEGDDEPHVAVARRALENGRVGWTAAARAAGLRVLTWRPGREPLEAVLLRRKVVA